MIVDGSLVPGSVVYSQTVDVVNGQAYTLSLWLEGSFSMAGQSPARSRG
jgi:hypothetical protein